jgi:hypothetical protein
LGREINGEHQALGHTNKQGRGRKENLSTTLEIDTLAEEKKRKKKRREKGARARPWLLIKHE